MFGRCHPTVEKGVWTFKTVIYRRVVIFFLNVDAQRRKMCRSLFFGKVWNRGTGTGCKTKETHRRIQPHAKEMILKSL